MCPGFFMPKYSHSTPKSIYNVNTAAGRFPVTTPNSMANQSNIFDDVLRVANPHAVAVTPDHVQALTNSNNRNGLSGNADRRPMVYRAGALDANECPSRMGNRLHYRDGRVEVLS